MKRQSYVRLYRFHDSVAFDMDDTETLYISYGLARRLAALLTACCFDIKDHGFGESKFGTVSVVERKIGEATTFTLINGNDVTGAGVEL